MESLELRELEVKTDSDDDESDDEIEVKIDISPRNGMGRRSRSGPQRTTACDVWGSAHNLSNFDC